MEAEENIKIVSFEGNEDYGGSMPLYFEYCGRKIAENENSWQATYAAIVNCIAAD